MIAFLVLSCLCKFLKQVGLVCLRVDSRWSWLRGVFPEASTETLRCLQICLTSVTAGSGVCVNWLDPAATSEIPQYWHATSPHVTWTATVSNDSGAAE